MAYQPQEFIQLAGLGIGASPGTTAGITFDAASWMNNYSTGTWIPTLDGSVSGTTGYSTQTGYYTYIGNLVFAQFLIVTTSATGTGNLVLGGLPYKVKNQTNGATSGCVTCGDSTTFVASTTMLTLLSIINTKTMNIYCSGTGTAGGLFQIANQAFSFTGAILYQV